MCVLNSFFSLLQIWSDLQPGALVTNMFAKDLDAGENGTVTFSLVAGVLFYVFVITISCHLLLINAFLRKKHILFFFLNLEHDDLGHFEIDSETGDIRTTELFTHNTKPYYTLKVTAKDNGAAPQEDTAVIHVQVQCLILCILCVVFR